MEAEGFTLNGIGALVTGANGGIGRALVAGLLERGASRVWAGCRSGAIDFGDQRVSCLRLDITRDEDVAAAAAACTGIRLLVNNAGVNHNARLIAQPDLLAAREEMEVNYFGTLRMCRAFAPMLRPGAIVNVLTMAAHIGMPRMGSYSASKAAELRLTECVRAELEGQGTRVMAFFPGAVDTRMTQGLTGVPKLDPADVARALLDGLETGKDEVVFGSGAQRTERLLREDRALLERELAATVRPA